MRITKEITIRRGECEKTERLEVEIEANTGSETVEKFFLLVTAEVTRPSVFFLHE